MLIGCICKPYEIEIDGKPLLIENERLVGIVREKDDCYFRGVVFDEDDKGGDGVILTKEEFNARVENWCEILVNAPKFYKNYYETWTSGNLLNQQEVDNFATSNPEYEGNAEAIAFKAGFLCGLYKHRTQEL